MAMFRLSTQRIAELTMPMPSARSAGDLELLGIRGVDHPASVTKDFDLGKTCPR